MENLPKDPFMLLSYVNTQLRDNYPSLDELCGSLGIETTALQEVLGGAGFEYNVEQNHFW